jgi:hypothetical protein
MVADDNFPGGKSNEDSTRKGNQTENCSTEFLVSGEYRKRFGEH